MAEEAAFQTEEKLTTLIEKIITSALDEQQQNLFNIISANFEIYNQQIDEPKKEINQLRHIILKKFQKTMYHAWERIQDTFRAGHRKCMIQPLESGTGKVRSSLY